MLVGVGYLVKKTIPKEKNENTNLPLMIESPVNNSTLNQSSLVVKGKTKQGITVFVNDEESKSDSSGIFTTNVTLDEGENNITVIVNDENGNFVEKELTINYESL